MEYNLYAIRNKLSRQYESLYPYTTDQMASKYLTLLLVTPRGPKDPPTDLNEYEIVLVGRYNIETGVVQGVDHCIVPFDSRFDTSTPNSNPNVDDRKIFVEQKK